MKLSDKIKRILWSGAVGATGATALFIFQNHLWIQLWNIGIFWLLYLVLYLAIVGSMIRIAFPEMKKKNRRKTMVLFFILASLFAGILMMQPNSMKISTIKSGNIFELTFLEFIEKGILFLAILPIVHMFLGEWKIIAAQYYEIEIEIAGKKKKGIGFLDSGNCLRSPILKEPVAVTEYAFIKNLFTEEEQETLNHILNWEMEPTAYTEAIVCIPYHSLGNKNGMLFGIYVDHLRIKQGREMKDHVHALIGLYNQKVSAGEEYQVILHADYIK